MKNLYTFIFILLIASGCLLQAQTYGGLKEGGSAASRKKGVILNTSNCENRPVTFSISGLEQPVQSYLWDFGTGITSDLSTPIYTYQTTGEYMVRVTVQYVNGTSDVLTKNIKVGKTPVPDFTASQTEGSYPFVVQFNNMTSGVVLTYLWNFGNYATSNAWDPTYQYANATKEYDVTLTAISPEGCEASVTKHNFIHVNSKPVYTVFIPNTFSPNNDGMNESFVIYGENIIHAQMDIYDQTGRLIFTQNGLDPINKGWNGDNMSNSPLPAGSYSYKIVVTDELGVAHESVGNVNLMR